MAQRLESEVLLPPPCLKDLSLDCLKDCPVINRSGLTFRLKAIVMRVSFKEYIETLRADPDNLRGVQESIAGVTKDLNKPVICARGL